MSLFILGIFSLTLPYFNALSVSKRSQKSELEKVLTANNLLVNGKIDFNKRTPYKAVGEIADKFNYLYERGDNSLLQQFVDAKHIKTINGQDRNRNYRNINGTITGFFRNIDQKHNIQLRTEIYTRKMVYATAGYQYVSKINHSPDNMKPAGLSINGDNIILTNHLHMKDPVLEISVNGSETVNLLPFIIKELAAHTPQTERIPVDEISTIADFEKYEVKILFDNLVYEPAIKNRYYFSDAIMLIKVK